MERSVNMSENVELNNTSSEMDELENDIAESESLFSTQTCIDGHLREFTIIERFFDTCTTCKDIDEPSSSFKDSLSNLAEHEK